MKGLLHAHSDYSHDGLNSLAELAYWGGARGLGCILLSEHAEDIDAAKMEAFVRECDASSNPECRLIPGLEFAVRGGFHILGLNLRTFEPHDDPVAAISFIREHGGLAVLAHPARYQETWPNDEALALLDGVEVWNATYDGRFLPSGRVLAACEQQRARHGHLLFFGGPDLHAVTSNRLVTAEVPGATEVASFLVGLKEGRARFGAGRLSFSSRDPLGLATLHFASLGHAFYRLGKGARDLLRRYLHSATQEEI